MDVNGGYHRTTPLFHLLCPTEERLGSVLFMCSPSEEHIYVSDFLSKAQYNAEVRLHCCSLLMMKCH